MGRPRAREAVLSMMRCSLTLVFVNRLTGMKFFRTQPPPTSAAPPDPARPTEKATVADIMLAYRLILKREADPAGLADSPNASAKG